MVLAVLLAASACGPRVIPRGDMEKIMADMLIQDQQINPDMPGSLLKGLLRRKNCLRIRRGCQRSVPGFMPEFNHGAEHNIHPAI